MSDMEWVDNLCDALHTRVTIKCGVSMTGKKNHLMVVKSKDEKFKMITFRSLKDWKNEQRNIKELTIKCDFPR